MISPDVAAAVTRLERDRVLAPEQARLFGRIARGELISLSRAIQALLYLGVLALTTGAGLFFEDEIERLGPVTLAFAVGGAAVLCLAWVARKSPPFSRDAVVSPHVAFDYVLATGAMLAAADLAFIESQFATLGGRWAFHLLVVSAFYLGLAFRFDSRSLFALSLTTFAAWRGVAATSVERAFFGFLDEGSAVRLNALACGGAFVVAGRVLNQRQLKTHFEPVATHLGWLLILQAIAWGVFDGEWVGLHRLILLAVGSGLAFFAWRGGRFALFVFGVLAAYFAFFVALADVVGDGTLIFFLVGLSAIALLFGLAAAHRRFPKEAQE